MKIAICDDESYWREELSELLKKYSRLRKAEIYTTYFRDGASLFDSSQKFDIIFMDYQMEELDGIETARQLRAQNNSCTIIFVSAYPSAALDTFEVNAFRFIAKPIDREKLFKALDDYRANAELERSLLFRTHNGTVCIKESDIIYCESDKRHTIIHTADETYEILINIKEIEKLLSQDYFFRCHRAYIVAFSHIKSHDSIDIILDNNAKAYISRSRLSDFKSAFQDYIIKYNMGNLK